VAIGAALAGHFLGYHHKRGIAADSQARLQRLSLTQLADSTQSQADRAFTTVIHPGWTSLADAGVRTVSTELVAVIEPPRQHHDC